METKNLVLIVYNAPSGLEKDFLEQVNAYARACEKANLRPVSLKEEEVLDFLKNNEENVKFVVFYSKDIYLARYLEAKNIKVFNSSEAISVCDDKALTYAALINSGVNTPKTFVLPYTYGINIKNKYSDIESMILKEGFTYPFVIKQRVGSFGNGVYKIKNKDDLDNIIDKYGDKNLLVQAFITGCDGVDYRVNVIGDKVVSIIRRVNTLNFKSNVHQGGHMELVDEYDKDMVELAIKASKACKCDFAGVDIIYKDNTPIVCEVNSNARSVEVTKINNIDVAYLIIKYLSNK